MKKKGKYEVDAENKSEIRDAVLPDEVGAKYADESEVLDSLMCDD